MRRDVLPVLMSVALACAYSPCAVANSQLNFKIYSPGSADSAKSVAPSTPDTFKIYTPPASDGDGKAAAAPPSADTSSNDAPASAEAAPAVSAPAEASSGSAAAAPATADSAPMMPINSTILQSETPQTDAGTPSASSAFDKSLTPSEMNATNPSGAPEAAVSADTAVSGSETSDKTQLASKVLQGYVRVVPTGTKIPIIMDTAVDSDTSQEGDEFEARTGEDLTIDGQIAVPAGSVIKGRIAQLNAPKHMLRPGSVALKFDTVTTPDSRQIPLVANLVARGGVVHARRGMKDIAMDTGTFALPTAAGLAIGAVAGNSSSSLGVGGGALIGAGVGAAVGLAVLLAKKGKKIDVRPGDELKIELAEDLRMPTM